MSFKSFREILVKKSMGNNLLIDLIHSIDEDFLVDKVSETLEKMARAGNNASGPVAHFANESTMNEINFLRDALAHHISRHKAALRAGNREVADKHLDKIMPLMHLANKLKGLSKGKIDFDTVSVRPWEMNYSGVGKNNETQGFGRRPNRTANRLKNPTAVPDYRYLEMAPHGEHADVVKGRITDEGGYPFEKIQLGSPSAVKNKKAYLHLSEPEKNTGSFVSHEFDHHPIMGIMENLVNEDKMTDAMKHDYIKQLHGWNASPMATRLLDRIASDTEKSPERGEEGHINSVQPEHHFKGLELINQPHKSESASATTTEVRPQSSAPSQAPNLDDVLKQFKIAPMSSSSSATGEKQPQQAVSSKSTSAPDLHATLAALGIPPIKETPAAAPAAAATAAVPKISAGSKIDYSKQNK